jgi:succinate dehydrogenase/fumarate reductase iron-sulfur protein
MPRKIRIFRYDPAQPGAGRFDSFHLEIPNETTTTILDVLLRLQQEQDPTLAFRFACRVNMCGSCGMVIDGREALACKTNVSEIAAAKEITIRPMNHFPVIKDLVVDMAPFFDKYESVLPFFQPKAESAEPARIRPDSAERLAIAGATECIACGCCFSSCTMVSDHAGYAGPAALNRAFTLLADSRDGLFAERLDRALESCYDCRTELNCTDVCPKGISPTRAIKYMQRLAVKESAAGEGSVKQRAWGFGLLGAGAAAVLAGLAFFSARWASGGSFTAAIALLSLLFSFLGIWNARRHPVFMAVGVSCAAGIIYLALTGSADARPYGDRIAVPARPLTSSEARGLSLYASLECASCHQIRGMGGRRTGPDLSNVAAKRRTREDLVRYIRNPQAVRGSSAMPPYPLPDSDLRALADFVLALDFGRHPAKIVKREEVSTHE